MENGQDLQDMCDLLKMDALLHDQDHLNHQITKHYSLFTAMIYKTVHEQRFQ